MSYRLPVLAVFELTIHLVNIILYYTILSYIYRGKRERKLYTILLVYYSQVLTNDEEHVYIQKYNIFILRRWRLCGEQSERESERERERECTLRSCRKSGEQTGVDFSQNFRPYVVLKPPRNPHAMLDFGWSWLTPTHCLFFIGHGLHPRNACFHWSRLTSTHAFSPLVIVYTHGYFFLFFFLCI